MSKSTPGPWHIIEVQSALNKDQPTYLLANKTPHVHGVMTGPMSDADLKLIVNAPDMFEILTDIYYSGRADLPEVQNKLNALIKKIITGE